MPEYTFHSLGILIMVTFKEWMSSCVARLASILCVLRPYACVTVPHFPSALLICISTSFIVIYSTRHLRKKYECIYLFKILIQNVYFIHLFVSSVVALLFFCTTQRAVLYLVLLKFLQVLERDSISKLFCDMVSLCIPGWPGLAV